MVGLVDRLLGNSPDSGSVGIDLDLGPRIHEPLPISRRGFAFGAVSSFALITAFGAWHLYTSREEQSSIPASLDQKTYLDRDTIETPIGEVRVDGWKLLFDQEHFLKVLEEGADFTYIARCEKTKTRHGVFRGSFKGGKPEITLSDLVLRPQDPNITTVNIPSSNYYYFNMFPHDELNKKSRTWNSDMVLELIIYKDRFPDRIYRYKIRPTIFSYFMEDDKDSIRLISERNIPGELLKPVHRIHQLFSGYGTPNLFYIIDEDMKKIRGYKGRSTEFAESHPVLARNILTVDGFRMPFFPNQSEIGACHEIAHNIFNSETIFERIGRKTPKAIAKNELMESFEALRQYHHHFGEIFSILTESNYFGVAYGVRSDAGHPADDYSEMFASTVCVLRYFSKGFCESYSRRNATEKKLISRACNATIQTLLSINPSQEVLTQL